MTYNDRREVRHSPDHSAGLIRGHRGRPTSADHDDPDKTGSWHAK